MWNKRYIYIKNCWVRLLSNYNIKYICTIYTRLDTCLMSISRLSLRGKVTIRLLKLYFNVVDVVEWSRALDMRLSEWCSSASMVWVQIRRGKNKYCQLKDLILTLFGLIFWRIYIFNLMWILQSNWLIRLEKKLVILGNLGRYCDVTNIFVNDKLK